MTETTQATPETTNDGGAAPAATAGAPVVEAQAPATATATTTSTEATQTTEAAKPVTEEPAKVEGAPEAYAFKAPEGKEFNSDVLSNFEQAARELNLSQDAAQTILDKVAPAIEAAQQKALDATKAQWETDTRNDPELGGAKLDANLATAKKALEAFGSPELKNLLNDSGLGNHPEVIRMFAKAGKAISEDTFVAGRQSPAASAQPASVLYPTHS